VDACAIGAKKYQLNKQRSFETIFRRPLFNFAAKPKNISLFPIWKICCS
jgi:hypothetical protein